MTMAKKIQNRWPVFLPIYLSTTLQDDINLQTLATQQMFATQKLQQQAQIASKSPTYDYSAKSFVPPTGVVTGLDLRA